MNVDSATTFSGDRRYRYVLERDVSYSVGDFGTGAGDVVWVMLNPSTADEAADDHTIRKCLGFSRSWGMGRLTVVNLYAWVSTDKGALLKVPDPVGDLNDSFIRSELCHADRVIVAWGALHKLQRHRAEHVAKLIQLTLAQRRQIEKSVSGRFVVPYAECLGRTSAGDPRHPLMLSYDTELETF